MVRKREKLDVGRLCMHGTECLKDVVGTHMQSQANGPCAGIALQTSPPCCAAQSQSPGSCIRMQVLQALRSSMLHLLSQPSVNQQHSEKVATTPLSHRIVPLLLQQLSAQSCRRMFPHS